MHFIVKCFLSTHSRWPPPPLRCSHRRCQLKQLAARDPHYFILLERHTLPPPFCLRCTLAMIHTVLSEANYFFFSSTKAPLGELLDSLWQLEVFFFFHVVSKCMTWWCLEPLTSRTWTLLPWGFFCDSSKWARGWQEEKDTVSPGEQHCPSYHLAKDAADWPHVHCGHTHRHTHTHIALSIKKPQKTSPP